MQNSEYCVINITLTSHNVPPPPPRHAADSVLPVEGSDFTVHTDSVRMNSTTPVGVDVTFQVDSVALEWDESVSLSLVKSGAAYPPTEKGVFFINTINVTIVDSTGEFI